MNSQTLISFIDNQDKLDALSLQAIDECERKYPYFQTLKLLKLKNLANVRSLRFSDEFALSVPYFTDRKNMLLIIDNEEFLWFKLLKAEVSDKINNENPESSFILIENFLSKIKNSTLPNHLPYEKGPGAESSAEIGVDYIKELQERPDIEVAGEDQNDQDQIIDAFINADVNPHIIASSDSVSEDKGNKGSDIPLNLEIKEDAFLTESLARIYIKQKKYSKALEIIKKLSLKYPEKNVYFADQIRFLEIIITNIKT